MKRQSKKETSSAATADRSNTEHKAANESGPPIRAVAKDASLEANF